MTNTNTKRALLSSVLALFLCFAMLLGTTFAWFTDEVISENNKIQAGTLKIDLLVRDADGNYNSVKESKAPIFDYALWEPGYTAVANVKVKNDGTLALQYSMNIVTDGLVDALMNEEPLLSDVIDVYYAASEVVLADRDAFDAAVEPDADGNVVLKHVGTLTDVLFGGSMIKDTLLKDEEDFATIVLKMQETADNTYQGLSVGTSFDIKIFATQYTYEEDSFDNQYDHIELPSATMMVIEPELLRTYNLDAGCVFMSAEDWNDDWAYDYDADQNADGTPAYAFYFADFVANVETTDDVVLWGMYGEYGDLEFDAHLEGGADTRVIPLADAALSPGSDWGSMGNISYRQLVDEVKTFACGVKGLEAGNTITITLRLYETEAQGTGFVETGVYHDIAIYTYTQP